MFTVESGNFARRFAIDSAFLQIGAFIARDFALGHADLSLKLSSFPIELEHDESAPTDLAFAVKLVDFLAVQEEFANALRAWNFVARFFIRLNIRVVEKRFSFFDARECVADISFAGADRLDFAALELDAGFVTLKNVKVAQGLAIENRFGGHIRATVVAVSGNQALSVSGGSAS